jgi:hypothetical protein
MKWVRLDSTFYTHPKVLALLAKPSGYRAVFVWTACLAYAGDHETDGLIPFTAKGLVHARDVDFRLLVEHRLMDPDREGWRIHNWQKYQPTKATMQVKSQMARDAANTRWRKHAEGS